MRKSQGTTSNGIFFTNQRYVDASQMIRQTEQAKNIKAVEKSSRWLWIKSVACTTHGVAHHLDTSRVLITPGWLTWVRVLMI